MTEQPIYVTREGLKKLEEELEYLRTVKRAEVAQRLHDAMGEGDIDENAEYDDAKNEQSFVEGRILTLETMVKNAAIIQQEGKRRDQVALGSTVSSRFGRSSRMASTSSSAEASSVPRRISFTARLEIDQAAERRQVFDEAWRINRDYFYDPNMHGADWKGAKTKYGALYTL